MEDAAAVELFADLQVPARGRLFATRPGRHRSRGLGAGGAFASLVSLLDHPDPRRIDVRASIADPFEAIHVRRYRQTVTARVVVIVDTSGSMEAQGRTDRRRLATVLAAGLARAVERSSDSYGLLLGEPEGEPLWPPTRRRGLSADVLSILDGQAFGGEDRDRLDTVIERLPRSRSIVFLISDFTQPLDWLAERLDRMIVHDVRPLVLRDSGLEMPEPRFGLVELQDLERRRRRLVLMRPSLARQWKEDALARRQALGRLFDEREMAAIDVVDQIDLEALTDGLLIHGGRA